MLNMSYLSCALSDVIASMLTITFCTQQDSNVKSVDLHQC